MSREELRKPECGQKNLDHESEEVSVPCEDPESSRERRLAPTDRKDEQTQRNTLSFCCLCHCFMFHVPSLPHRRGTGDASPDVQNGREWSGADWGVIYSSASGLADEDEDEEEQQNWFISISLSRAGGDEAGRCRPPHPPHTQTWLTFDNVFIPISNLSHLQLNFNKKRLKCTEVVPVYDTDIPP